MFDTDLSNRHQLKTLTKERHSRTETTWFAGGRFEGQGHYIEWLGAMLDVHCDLGLRAATRLGRQDDLTQEHLRFACLTKDLKRDGSPLTAESDETESWAWGVQYALNGSALGAGVLLKHDVSHHDWPIAYLQCMTGFAKSGALKRFFDDLDAQDLQMTDACAGALAVFDALAVTKRSAPNQVR
ncbi:MAG: hypothetical protein MK098_04655 [Marinovum sp.]|nr:hypothetical protein [Marinovum sp.]